MEAGERPIYSISAVSRMLAVPVPTIRTWEDRYGLVVPERSSGGHRLYTRDEVESLRFVREQLDRGLSAADAHRLLAARVNGDADETGPDLHGERLLVLLGEADRFAAQMQEYFLRTEGFRVEIAPDDASVRRSCASGPPAVLVIELLISGGAGLQLCHEMRQAHADLPIIAVSVLDAREDAVEAGADAFLAKPLDPLMLVSTVRDLLGTSAFLHPPTESRSE